MQAVLTSFLAILYGPSANNFHGTLLHLFEYSRGGQHSVAMPGWRPTALYWDCAHYTEMLHLLDTSIAAHDK